MVKIASDSTQTTCGRDSFSALKDSRVSRGEDWLAHDNRGTEFLQPESDSVFLVANS